MITPALGSECAVEAWVFPSNIYQNINEEYKRVFRPRNAGPVRGIAGCGRCGLRRIAGPRYFRQDLGNDLGDIGACIIGSDIGI